MTHDIPAPGYTLTNGKKPRLSAGTKLLCQIRSGWCDPMAWPVETTRWEHDGSAGDVVAVRRVG